MKVTKKGNIEQDGKKYVAKQSYGCNGCAFEGSYDCDPKPCQPL